MSQKTYDIFTLGKNHNLAVVWHIIRGEAMPYVVNGGYYLIKTESPTKLRTPITDNIVHYLCQITVESEESYDDALDRAREQDILFDAKELS